MVALATPRSVLETVSAKFALMSEFLVSALVAG
jgi:hypothetical protein